MDRALKRDYSGKNNSWSCCIIAIQYAVRRLGVMKRYTSTNDQEFLGKFESYFGSQHEILAMIRYSHAGGARSFEFFSSFQSLTDRIRGLQPLTSIIIFRQPQLSLRGIVNDDFMSRCMSFIPEGSEYLVVETVRGVYGSRSWFHDGSGVSHAELRDDLEECRGSPVAVGLYPPWLKDTADVISAFVPDEHGVVKSGVY